MRKAARDQHAKRQPIACGVQMISGHSCSYACRYCYIQDWYPFVEPTPTELSGNEVGASVFAVQSELDTLSGLYYPWGRMWSISPQLGSSEHGIHQSSCCTWKSDPIFNQVCHQQNCLPATGWVVSHLWLCNQCACDNHHHETCWRSWTLSAIRGNAAGDNPQPFSSWTFGLHFHATPSARTGLVLLPARFHRALPPRNFTSIKEMSLKADENTWISIANLNIFEVPTTKSYEHLKADRTPLNSPSCGGSCDYEDVLRAARDAGAEGVVVGSLRVSRKIYRASGFREKIQHQLNSVELSWILSKRLRGWVPVFCSISFWMFFMFLFLEECDCGHQVYSFPLKGQSLWIHVFNPPIPFPFFSQSFKSASLYDRYWKFYHTLSQSFRLRTAEAVQDCGHRGHWLPTAFHWPVAWQAWGEPGRVIGAGMRCCHDWENQRPKDLSVGLVHYEWRWKLELFPRRVANFARR